MKAKNILWLAFGLCMALTFSACTRDSVSEPSPTGPSTYASVLKISAAPNVLYAGDTRQAATVTASLKRWDGTPLANKTIYFEINDESDMRVNVGYLEGHKNLVAKVTDGAGIAYIGYYAPIKTEITGNILLHIWATVSMDGSEFIQDFAPIDILR
jgi:hypothetical protein